MKSGGIQRARKHQRCQGIQKSMTSRREAFAGHWKFSLPHASNADLQARHGANSPALCQTLCATLPAMPSQSRGNGSHSRKSPAGNPPWYPQKPCGIRQDDHRGRRSRQLGLEKLDPERTKDARGLGRDVHRPDRPRETGGRIQISYFPVLPS